MGWAYGSTVVGLCEAVKASTAKHGVLWLGASGQNSKQDGVGVFDGSELSQVERILEVARRFGSRVRRRRFRAPRGMRRWGAGLFRASARGDC